MWGMRWARDLVRVMEAGGGWLLSRAETCSCTLGSNVNTPLPPNKISCVRQEHALYYN